MNEYIQNKSRKERPYVSRESPELNYNVPPPIYQDIMNMIYSIYDIDYHEDFTVQDISEDVFNPEYFSIDCPDFDAEEDKYMAISVNYRGDVKAKEANATVQWLKTNKKVTFVEWCPTGFKVGLNDEPHKMLPNEALAAAKRNVTMIANNTYMGFWLNDRISKVYDKMYSQRAFVHWFVGEGMEEGEFAEAREDLGFLLKDYLDMLSEQVTDDYDESD